MKITFSRLEFPRLTCSTTAEITASADWTAGTPPMPLPRAGKARDDSLCFSASASVARVAAEILAGSAFRSLPMVTAWMTWVAARLPATVRTASPISIGPWRSASSSITNPPLRFNAPATPAPIRSPSLAAFTTASTSASVMSPRSTTTVVFRSCTSWPRSGPLGLFCLHCLPRPIEVLHRRLGDRPSPGPHLHFHLSKSPRELLGGAPQAFLGVQPSQPGHVDHREQQVAELVRHPVVDATLERLTDLTHLLLELRPGILPAR